MAALSSINPLYSLSGFVVGLLVGLTGVGGGSLMTLCWSSCSAFIPSPLSAPTCVDYGHLARSVPLAILAVPCKSPYDADCDVIRVPDLRDSPLWKKRIKVARNEVLPRKAEDGAICETAQKIARGIREEL
jgi:hypothetical protein